MGKGKRTRAQKAARAADAPRRAVPEMLPNTADSPNDLARPGYGLSEHSRDAIDPDVNAWAMLNTYLGMVMDLEEWVRPRAVPAAEIDHKALARDVAAQLRELAERPALLAEFAYLEHNVSEFVGHMKPRWRGRVTKVIFAEVDKWLTETGHQPDRAEWFAGAQVFIPVMVPPAHREATRMLLDYDALLADTERINSALATPVPELAVDKPDSSVWFARAMRGSPVAMVHAAAALAAWIHAQPGAVAAVNEKRLELGRRALKFLEIVAHAPGRDPNGPQEDEPAYVAPWEARPAPEPDQPTGELVDIVYDGPPMTPWTAAYLWASLITTLGGFRRRRGTGPSIADVPDPGDSAARALIARAISIQSRVSGVTGNGLIAGPGMLAELSLARLTSYVQQPGLVIHYMDEGYGHRPTPGELGYQAYQAVYETIRAGGVTIEEVAADRQLNDEIQRSTDELLTHLGEAGGLLIRSLQLAIPDSPDAAIPEDVYFGQLGHYLNEYLPTAAVPDEDTEFRALMEQEVGWPGGNPPAGLITDPGPWTRLTYTPTTEPGGEKGWAFTRWLVRRGWGVESDPGRAATTVWVDLPLHHAQDVRQATEGYTFELRDSTPWTEIDGVGDAPTQDYLRERYATESGGPPPRVTFEDLKNHPWRDLSPAQAAGQRCIMCCRNYEHFQNVDRCPAGRDAATNAQVFACGPHCVEDAMIAAAHEQQP